MARVLVVEGDAVLRAGLTASLTEAGHEVESASSGQAGVALARASNPDIVVFDLHLPDTSGLELCRTLRAPGTKRPSLFVLTAANEEADRVAAFEAGVDDYVTKPHSMRELVLRVRALSRRRATSAPEDDLITIGSIKIDRAARRVDVDGASVELTRREFDLLLRLAERVSRVQTRDALVTEVWGELADSGRVVDTTVKRLRKKLGSVGASIKTVRGVGYKLIVG
ncbi:MAG: response regulator transcription factor [Labilithrix sp.]|nr:response regulator transcription factor [Labilithrix sp.]MBX3224438.1 response regulator transcription factor [Labilithrix sp.]